MASEPPQASGYYNVMDKKSVSAEAKKFPPKVNIQGESLARGPKLLSMYTVEQCGFLVRKY